MTPEERTKICVTCGDQYEKRLPGDMWCDKCERVRIQIHQRSNVGQLQARIAALEGALQALKDSKAIQFTFMDGSRQNDLTHPVAAANHALRVLSGKTLPD